MPRKITTEEFIERSHKIHGHKYDYSVSKYIDSYHKIKINCPIHGLFIQFPYYHLDGNGCQKCGGNIKLTTQFFIQKAHEIHGDKYDYSLVKYHKNNHTKIKINCKEHGEFKQIPNNHLNGSGCPKCKAEKLRNQNKTKFRGRYPSSIQKFITKASKIHNNRYNYSNFQYINSQTKGIIKCPVHGEFRQTPNNHISLSNTTGCPKCNLSKGESKIIEYLEKSGIIYISQKTFCDCKNPKTNAFLKFDFYLPNKNLLIEFDGEQHYNTSRLGKHTISDTELKQIQFRDGIKTKYAIKNNIKLLRIKYTKINKIHEILKEQLYE
jgi:hypothetical protein